MNDSEVVERFLEKPDIHRKWIRTYYSSENEAFCEREFDHVIKLLNAPKDSVILDAGCGDCAHSIRLAKRGFFVQALDVSEAVLELARRNVTLKGFENRVHIQHGNLLALPYEDGTFSYALCCGVLMHIPDLEKAISELARVLRPGGKLVISETNMLSPEAVVLRTLKRLLKKGKAIVKKTRMGVEYWTTSADGTLMTRQSNIRLLIEEFLSHGIILRRRQAGQCTELYTRISLRPLNRLIHEFNGFWFRRIRIPHLAFGNMLILEKKCPREDNNDSCPIALRDSGDDYAST